MGANKSHITDVLFVLCLLLVFAASALFVVVLGADAYKGISGNLSSNDNARSSIAYISEKVRQHDAADAVALSSVEGQDALVLGQSAQGRAYETWIYVYDGQLYEVSVRQGARVQPGDGQAILPLQALDLYTPDERRLCIAVRDAQGESFESVVQIRCGRVRVVAA